MFYFVLGVHLFLCVILVGLVLSQQGKGASAGAILSGSSNTLFGAVGPNTALTKATTGIAIAFFLTSIFLVKLYGTQAVGGVADPLAGSVVEREAVQVAPAQEGAPVQVDSGEARNAAEPVSGAVAAPAQAAVPKSLEGAVEVVAPKKDEAPQNGAASQQAASKDAASQGNPQAKNNMVPPKQN